MVVVELGSGKRSSDLTGGRRMEDLTDAGGERGGVGHKKDADVDDGDVIRAGVDGSSGGNLILLVAPSGVE